jgi:hypothetical protein
MTSSTHRCSVQQASAITMDVKHCDCGPTLSQQNGHNALCSGRTARKILFCDECLRIAWDYCCYCAACRRPLRLAPDRQSCCSCRELRVGLNSVSEGESSLTNQMAQNQGEADEMNSCTRRSSLRAEIRSVGVQTADRQSTFCGGLPLEVVPIDDTWSSVIFLEVS